MKFSFQLTSLHGNFVLQITELISKVNLEQMKGCKRLHGGGLIVEDSGFKNVKNKPLGMPPFKMNFHLFYPLVHSKGSIEPDIEFNLSLANIPVKVCLICN